MIRRSTGIPHKKYDSVNINAALQRKICQKSIFVYTHLHIQASHAAITREPEKENGLVARE